jgi:hypothetical protein
VTLEQLIQENRFNAPPSGPLLVPGDDSERAALGYMHGNCGHCHNESDASTPYAKGIGIVLWLHADELASATETATYATTIDQNTQSSSGIAGVRIVPGDLQNSVLYQRFVSTNSLLRMPPVGVEDTDPAGQQAIADWISGLE